MNKENTGQKDLIASDAIGCLRLISAGKRVVIEATQGTETLASAGDMFSYIDPSFKDWGCDKAEQATPETAVEIYEQIEDAEYRDIFGSLGQDPDRLALTTSQIRSFIANHAKDYLREAGDWTCFRAIFKAGGELFVADVRILSDGDRAVRISRFSDGAVRHSVHRHRIVVPQVALAK